MNLAELDKVLASHDLFSDPSHMHRVFKWLREEDPLHWASPLDHPPFWAVTKHTDVVQIGRNSDVFVAEPKTFLMNDKEVRIRAEATAATGGKLVRTMIHMDGNDHRLYRGLTQAYFMPQNVKRLEEVIHDCARALVTRLLEHGSGCDFYNEIAVWYPLKIIMGLLNVPESEHAYLLQLTQQFLAPQDPTLRRDNGEGGGKEAVAREYFDYFGKVLADRRSKPKTDGLDSLIAHAQVNGEPLGLMEAVSYYVILATAGHDTTSSSMGSGLYYLLREPGEQEKLREHPELLPSAIEEMFRFASPVKHFVRTATRDFELRGKLIRAGQEVALMYHSANFDEEVFDDPLRFKVDRGPNKQVAFGFGVHACLGQHLARTNMRVFFSELLARTGSLELDGEPAFIASNQVGGLKSLPVRFSPVDVSA